MISPDKSTDKLYSIDNVSNKTSEHTWTSSQVSSECINNPDSGQIQVYRRRWAVLAIFSLITLTNAFNWIEYNIIQG